MLLPLCGRFRKLALAVFGVGLSSRLLMVRSRAVVSTTALRVVVNDPVLLEDLNAHDVLVLIVKNRFLGVPGKR